MRISLRMVACHAALLFCLCFLSLAPRAAAVDSMKLITAQVGWAANDQKVFWTTTGGQTWEEITPKLAHKWQRVSSVWFLDSSTGWVLLNCADRVDDKADDTCFEIAATKDAGLSWAIVHPKITDPDSEAGFSGRTYLNFSDAMHGWAIMKVSRSTAFSFGVMLKTEDGGKTWKPLPQPPMAEPFVFVTNTDGWMAGGPNQALYVTRDGGKSWQDASISVPTNIGRVTGTDYDLPVFDSEQHGFLPVRYRVGPEMGPDLSTLVLLSTTDKGATWKQEGALTNLPDDYSPGTVFPSAMTDSIFFAATMNKENISLHTLSRTKNVSVKIAQSPVRTGPVFQVSFGSATNGWILTPNQILSTTDGGASWVKITPGSAPEKGLAHHSEQVGVTPVPICQH